MRFNNRFCALMDIPDLPHGAFEHIGDKKIKPQGGGGGGIVSAITDPISSAIGTDGGGGGILGAVEDVGQSVGSGLAEVDKFVNNEIPGGWILPAAAAIAAGTGYVDPTLFASTTAAETAAAGAGAAAAETAAPLTVAEILGSTGFTAAEGASFALPEILTSTALTEAAAAAATEALPYTEAFDAWNLAQQGLGATDIASNLTLSAGVDPFIAADMAAMATNGLTPEAIAQNLAYSYSSAELAPLGIKSLQATVPTKLSITPGQAMMGLKAASGLLGAGKAPQQPQMQAYNQSRVPQGAVDYSPILNLLNIQQAQRNKNSLLG
jgi:hypothetical protein